VRLLANLKRQNTGEFINPDMTFYTIECTRIVSRPSLKRILNKGEVFNESPFLSSLDNIL